MELRVLKYFLTVAREENINRAAALCHITQPTLSRQLRQMEDELGVKLFHRGSNNILLTEEGMLLRRRAQEIIDLTEKTEKELKHSEEVVSGEIYIGSGETRNMAALSEMITSFQNLYPEVGFRIYTAIKGENCSCRPCWCAVDFVHDGAKESRRGNHPGNYRQLRKSLFPPAGAENCQWLCAGLEKGQDAFAGCGAVSCTCKRIRK